MSQYIQEILPLFDPATFSEILAGREIHDIEIKTSKRLKRSWRISIDHNGTSTITVPLILNNAPAEIKNSIIDWGILQKKRVRHKNRRKKGEELRRLETIVFHYLNTNFGITRERPVSDKEISSYKTAGRKFDLEELLRNINREYFNNTIKTRIRWGREGSRTSYHTIKTDTNGERFHLITIAGIYNHRSVPRYALEAVIYHEMIHILIPPYKKNGRNIIHGPEFRKKEREFPFYSKWIKWLKTDLQKIISKSKR